MDVTAKIVDGKIQTDLHIKPTNPQLYLHFKSNHPPHVFNAIPYGQAIRVQTICSEPEFVSSNLSHLKEKLIERGYPLELIETQFRKAATINRSELLKQHVYPYDATPAPVGAEKRKFRPDFIITYNPHNPPLRKWLEQFHHILLSDPKMSKVRPKAPTIAFRQAPNLRQRLVKSTLKVLPFENLEDVEILEAGCYKFQHPRMGRPCVTCPRIFESKTFSSSYTKQSYKIRHHLTCKTSYVIYLVTCTVKSHDQLRICVKQYVGSTTEALHLRHSGHKSEIRLKSTPLGRHFDRCGIKNFSLQAIDCVKQGENEALLIVEGMWQHKLATFEANGNINKRDEMKK